MRMFVGDLVELRRCRRKALHCLMLAFVVALVSWPVAARAVLLNLADDTYISATAANSNYGTAGSTNVNVSGSISFLKFDLSSLPAGGASSNVVKATLTVFIGKLSSSGTIDLKRVITGPWDEAHVTAATAPTLGSTEVSASVMDTKSFVTFNVTGLVKDWVAHVLPNNGVALAPANSVAVQLNSKENTGTGHPATLEVTLATPCAGNDPQDIMVRVGSTCVDVYEASVWSTATGGVQYGPGATISNYPCNQDGGDCTNVYARSVAGVIPASKITWLQAQQACANSGKRLLRNAEWQMAASGTPYDGTDNGTTDCYTSCGDCLNTGNYPPLSAPTGSRSGCVSTTGVADMVGNLAEYVEDWLGEPFAIRGGSYAYGATSCAIGSGLLCLSIVDPFTANAPDPVPWGFRCGR